MEIAVLLAKPEQVKVDLEVKYKGLDIPPEFVVGFGLDYAERGRNLPALYSLHKD
jgi:hypoxanthine phosphoribosyltransferase